MRKALAYNAWDLVASCSPSFGSVLDTAVGVAFSPSACGAGLPLLHPTHPTERLVAAADTRSRSMTAKQLRL